MIIIEQKAEEMLINVLKTLHNREGKYGIHLCKASGGDEAYRRHHIIAQAHNYLPATDIYFFEDGEAFLLIQQASVKECKKAMLEIAQALGIQPVDTVGKLYELSVQTGTLLVLLEEKVEKEKKIRKALENQQSIQQAVYRKQKMLELPEMDQNISDRRKMRNKMQFMIIEDDPFSRRLVEMTLSKQYQYKMTWLDNAKDALATYAELAPDLLFLDINLPDVTGHELLEKIIALDPDAYVIMISGNADKHNIMQAMQCGAEGFIAKPFSSGKLLQYVNLCPTLKRGEGNK